MVAADNSAKLPGRYITNRQESAIERVSLLCMLDERGVTRFPGLDDAQAEGNSRAIVPELQIATRAQETILKGVSVARHAV